MSARSNQSSVNSGASSGSTQGVPVPFFFFGMAIPHTDDVPSVAARGPNKDHEPVIEPTRGDVARLSVRETGILARCDPALEHLLRIYEIKSALRERLIPLDRIVGDLQAIICNAK